MSDLSVQVAPENSNGLQLRNPITAASGTFGYGTEYARTIDIQSLGGIFCKGTTRRPRRGASLPRLVQTPCGVLHATGVPNPGVEAVIREKASLWARWQVPVIVNIAGESIDEYVEVVAALEGVPGVSGIELNLSPWGFSDAGDWSGDARLAAELTREVREATTLPLIVKLGAVGQELQHVAECVEAEGADALTLINAPAGVSIDIQGQRLGLGARVGGVSGPAIKPLALHAVYQVRKVVDIPLIGVGGVATLEDVLQFMMAGASCVQVGTATFAHPETMPCLIQELGEWMEREGVKSVHEIIGVAH